MKNLTQQRIAALRDQMKKAGVDATVIPQTDPHQGEYIADHWQARRMLSGFTGSAGTLVVTATRAFLWTDSRYFIQAADQLQGSGIELMKEGIPGTPDIFPFLAGTLGQGARVGINGWLFATDAVDGITAALSAAGLTLDTGFDPIDAIWPDRPALPKDKIFVHDISYAGQSAADKIAQILDAASRSAADSIFISALDEIAWTLNTRSRDVECNPVATAYLYLAPAGSTLLTDPAKLTDEVIAHLSASGVATRPYDDVAAFIGSIDPAAKVLIQPSKTSRAVEALLGSRAVRAQSPVPMLKACKNGTQIAGTRQAMIRDGVAMVASLMEIERKIAAGETLTEIGVDKILTANRAAQPLYFDNSFDTIAGYKAHGAIVHYSANAQTDATLSADGLLLIDSGAQYLDGTTDITRTISLGNPTAQQRRDFTLVMKGHIAIATAVFPAGTTGHQLDALARIALWKQGLSYLHGTGHGVGHFLNVHEGPQSIRLNHVPTPLTPGMITSNEPGLYREGLHGIRCENLVLTVPAMTNEFGDFYRFETLTLCPFDRDLFDTTLMTPDEIDWVDSYHATVAERLLPHLDQSQGAWLRAKTAPLAR